MSKRKQRTIKGPFILIPKRIMETPAWRTMSPEGRLFWIELRGWLRNDGLNNGKVHCSCRKAAEAIGLNKDTITRAYAENEHYGFLRLTSPGFLGSDGFGIAAKFCFTDLAHGTHPPTRDYEKWAGDLFVYTPRRRQNPVRPRRTPRPTASDIRRRAGKASVCPVASDIGEPPTRPAASDKSRLPLQSAAAGDGARAAAQVQGSSSRAPAANVGGAGSNPAPVAKATAKPGLSDREMVERAYAASAISPAEYRLFVTTGELPAALIKRH